MLIENLTWQDFEKYVKKGLPVVIPISPLEEHGPHLPLGTDFIRPHQMVKLAEKNNNFLIFPTIPLGVCRKTKGLPGTISVKANTLYNIVFDITESLIENGVKKIIFLSGHAGKTHSVVIEDTLSDIKEKHPEIRLYYIESAYMPHQFKSIKIVETDDKHAGEIETSEMLYLEPRLVRKNKLSKNYWKIPKGEILSKKSLSSKIGNGVWGDATKATREKGKKLVEVDINRLVAIIKDQGE